jgi:DNA-directed RNA polymerase sigma subunit (sigma70/sigma32)
MKTTPKIKEGLSVIVLDQIRQHLTTIIGAKDAEQFVRAEILYHEKILAQKEEKEDKDDGRNELETKIRDHFLSIDIPEEKITTFLNVQRSIKTLRKITHLIKDAKGNTRYQGLPTKEEYEEYSKLPKTLDSLNKIKHPLLYNWTPDEIVEAMSSYIGDNAKKYFSKRCEIEDCKQNGSIGLIKAIETDAGMAPFAKHSFSRIRTHTRRPSAQSGIVKMPEKRPSVTEVLQAITIFLTGKAKRSEQNRQAENKGFTSFEAITDPTIIQEIKDDVYDFFVETIINEQDLLGPIGSPELDEIAKQNGYNSFLQMSKTAPKPHEIINGTGGGGTGGGGIGVPLSWQFRVIQKTGQKDVYIWAVSGRFNLRDLDGDVLDNLVDYLNLKFNNSSGSKKVSLNASSADRIQCVADLVQLFAVNPDFHGNPVSLDGGGPTDQDDGVLTGTVSYGQKADSLAKWTDGKFIPATPFSQPDEVAEQKETIAKAQELIKDVELSDKQRVVFERIHGVNGNEKMEGSTIAKNFGKLTGGTKPAVSRQRIAQFQEASDKKMQDLAWMEFEEDPKFYSLIKTARRLASLTKEEDSLLAYAYGLDGMRIWEMDDIARHYDTLIGAFINDNLSRLRSEKLQLEAVDADSDDESDEIQASLKKLGKDVELCVSARLKYVQKKLKGAQMKILLAMRC